MPDPKETQMFAAIVGNISKGIYVLQDDRAIFLNDHFGSLFGFDRVDSLIGRNMYREIYPDPQTVGLFRSVHDRMLAENSSQVSWAQLSCRADGTPFWLEVEAKMIVIDDRPAVLGIFHDQTECQLMAEAMHVSMGTLRLLLDAMEDRVYVVTDDYKIVYANRKMMEEIEDDLETTPCYALCRGQAQPCADCSADKVFTTNQPIHKEYFNEKTQSWLSVIELAIRMPGIDRPTKLAVSRDITHMKEAEQRIRALSHRLLKVQENERKHLSRELHDNLGQRLNAAKIGLETLAADRADLDRDFHSRTAHLCDILQNSIESVRHLSSGLRPPSLEKLGLVETIRNHCQKHSQLNNLPIEFKCAGMKGIKLDSEVEINLFRVVQEALHNVIKHAEATEVRIRLVASYPTIRLRIEDDGKGLEVGKIFTSCPKGSRLGMVGMAERAESMKGSFQVDSSLGEGTRIVVEIPLEEK